MDHKDYYDLIEKFRAFVRKAYVGGVTKTKIMLDTGISYATLNDIMDRDMENLRVRKGPLAKIQVYMDRQDKLAAEKNKVTDKELDDACAKAAKLVEDGPFSTRKIEDRVELDSPEEDVLVPVDLWNSLIEALNKLPDNVKIIIKVN